MFQANLLLNLYDKGQILWAQKACRGHRGIHEHNKEII